MNAMAQGCHGCLSRRGQDAKGAISLKVMTAIAGTRAVAKTVHLAPESQETRQLPGCTQLLVQGSVSTASRGAPGFGCHCNQGIEGRCTSLFPIPTDPLGSGNTRSHLPGGSGEEPISQASPTQLPAPVLVNF